MFSMDTVVSSSSGRTEKVPRAVVAAVLGGAVFVPFVLRRIDVVDDGERRR